MTDHVLIFDAGEQSRARPRGWRRKVEDRKDARRNGVGIIKKRI
jgi:hypothetical protein